MHELSIVQSSLFSHAMTNGGTTGGWGGRGSGGSGGLGVGVTAIGGGRGDEAPWPGTMGCAGGWPGSPGIGDGEVGGLSVAIAEQP